MTQPPANPTKFQPGPLPLCPAKSATVSMGRADVYSTPTLNGSPIRCDCLDPRYLLDLAGRLVTPVTQAGGSVTLVPCGRKITCHGCGVKLSARTGVAK